jgi:hypothetical protein
VYHRAPMRTRVGWVLGALGGLAAYRAWSLRRGRRGLSAVKQSGADPRAEELRRRLDESRAIVEERDEFEAGETTVDRAEPTLSGLDDRRRQVHEQGRATVERMRPPSDR